MMNFRDTVPFQIGKNGRTSRGVEPEDEEIDSSEKVSPEQSSSTDDADSANEEMENAGVMNVQKKRLGKIPTPKGFHLEYCNYYLGPKLLNNPYMTNPDFHAKIARKKALEKELKDIKAKSGRMSSSTQSDNMIM